VLLGAVKSNIGHLESAAGIAGLIKATLALRHGMVPPNLNFRRPNPGLDLGALNIRVATRATRLKGNGHAPFALVNSFGFGGANACLLLGRAPAEAKRMGRRPAARPSGTPLLFPISAADPEALRALAQRLHGFVGREARDRRTRAAVASTLALRRAHLAERAVVRAADGEELARGLRALASARGAGGGRGVRPIWRGRAQRPHKVAFVFSGQGAQWPGMGRDLLAADPIFRDAVAAFDCALARHAGWSVADGGRARTPRRSSARTWRKRRSSHCRRGSWRGGAPTASSPRRWSAILSARWAPPGARAR
jgi:acyl transferase domain-containing protein